MEDASKPPERHDARTLTRREVIERVGRLLGGVALVGQSAMLAGCAAPGAGRREASSAASGALFSRGEMALIDEIAETILPETRTPGAKAAGVGPFIALMVEDAYTARDQQIFKAGLQTIDDASRAMHGVDFMTADPGQRRTLLERLDEEQMVHMRSRTPEEPAHYFRMLKELALLGYFTSEIGYMQAMRYIEAPGRFDPCVPYAPGEKIWAPHA